jgi:hypothetical protein
MVRPAAAAATATFHSSGSGRWLAGLALLALLASPLALAEERHEPASDEALAAELKATQDAMTTERAAATRRLYQLAAANYDARLAALAKAGPPGRTAQIEALRQRLVRVWNLDHQALTRQWPVDPRLGCRDQHHGLLAALEKPQSPQAKADLPRVRAEAQACLERMEPPVELLQSANREVKAVVAEIEALLGPEPAAPASSREDVAPQAPPQAPGPTGGR